MRDPQAFLFPAKEFAKDSDLGRLTKAIEILPDDKLICALEKQNDVGRPLSHSPRVLWHVLIAGVVYRHHFLSKLLEELRRNSDLRMACGILTEEEVPTAYEMSRFLKKLVRHLDLVEEMFANLLYRIREIVPSFGMNLACDSKHIHSYSRGSKESSDKEASWGIKTKIHTHSDGTSYETTSKWFGYKLHILIDSVLELPISYKITTAKEEDGKQLIELVEKGMENLSGGEKNPKIFEDVPLAADKGYDATENCQVLHNRYGIKPVIDMIHQQDPKTKETVYDRDRLTRIMNEKTRQHSELKFLGYEKGREALKYGCPCDGKGLCPYYGASCNKSRGGSGAIFRIKLSENPRYYTPIPRESKKWKREYRKRTSVERVNSRLGQVLEIDHSGFRGKDKVGVRCTIGLLVMLAHALSCLKSNRVDLIRSLTKAAA